MEGEEEKRETRKSTRLRVDVTESRRILLRSFALYDTPNDTGQFCELSKLLEAGNRPKSRLRIEAKLAKSCSTCDTRLRMD